VRLCFFARENEIGGRKHLGDVARKRLTGVFYIKPKIVSAVAYLPTLKGVQPVAFKLVRAEVERILASSKIRKKWLVGGRTEAVSAQLSGEGLALLVLRVPDVCKVANFKELDAAIREAYRRYESVKSTVDARALEKVGDRSELASAYTRAWLKAKNLEVAGDDPDAELVSQQYYRLVWRFGDRYVIQDPPWC